MSVTRAVFTEADDAGGDSKGGKPSQATQMVELGEVCDLWHDPDGVEYASLPVADHREHHPIRSKPFRTWLRRRYYERHGKAPGSQGVQDAVETLCGHALFEGMQHTAHVRLAADGRAVYLDLGDEFWRAVEITADGWKIVDDPPVRFRRTKGTQALPEPQRGGRLTELRDFINVSAGDWPLIASWLVASARPHGPYPVLNLLGEQGSAKTTSARVLRRLFDPNTADLRRAPKDERDLILAANNGRVVALDNLSGLWPWQSDALASLATGAGFATRTLYENEEETIFAACRPVILNGIEEVAVRSDLLDRSLLVYLEQIPERRRQTESAFWRRFAEAHPRLLGALLDALACGLARLDDVTLDCLPRMADFAEFAVACEPALDVDQGAFLAAYTGNRETAQDLALEASPVASAVRDHVIQRGAFHGTAGELHRELTTEERRKSKAWPASGQAMTGQLKRAAPSLRAAGLTVEYSQRDGRGRILWQLTTQQDWVPDSSASSGSSCSTSETPKLAKESPTQSKESPAGDVARFAHGTPVPDDPPPVDTP